MFLTALHFVSNVSVSTRTLLNQENWLTTSANGVIRNRQSHLLLTEHDNRTESRVLPFVLTYDTDLPEVRNTVNKHWPIIESSIILSEILTEIPIMAYRRPKSMWDLLVRAKVKPDTRDNEPLDGTRPCGKARCKTCKMITPMQITKSASGAIITLVYLITCTKCGKQVCSSRKHTYIILTPLNPTFI